MSVPNVINFQVFNFSNSFPAIPVVGRKMYDEQSLQLVEHVNQQREGQSGYHRQLLC